MELSEIIPHIEVLIFASDKPLTSLDIVELINNSFGFLEERISLDQVETAVEGIREKYAAEFYPFEVRESGGGWQFLTKKDYHKTIAQLNGDKFLKRLSNAALETLAIIGYKQPITKGEIEAIRGVNSDYSIQKLLEKELILISGRNEQLPGKPLVYATSKTFMDYFGINSAADLPKIKEVLAEQIVEGTIIKPEDFTDNQIADAMAALPTDDEIIEGDVSDLTVNEEGELIIAELNESSDIVSASEVASTDESTDATEDDSDNLSNDVEDENNPQ
ncbi:MAG TPA: SMC-Scp complex subunit ScpB [Sediminibacterium sp.]|uniref:SMC-Scp complex subunit ScpB n=1 Tax=Sediminibacterium sp. TaxID=1917865 RepID=UPI000AC34CC1|nr:SMC-Scp complex subunit ScpB [Sediminibacterium sp.]HLD52520.1 SMC-Scp complex subunit ScpB [Sediminibacterium sp.]